MSEEAAYPVAEYDAAPADASNALLHALFLDHFGAMVALARLMGSDDPQDTAQEAFARIHDRLGSIPAGAPTLAYLRRTVVNLSRNRVRHLAVVRRHVEHATDADSAETRVIERERSDMVFAAVQGLSKAQRSAVILRYWAELPYDEIAAALGCPTNTAKSHVRRAMRTLASCLEGERP